MNPFIRNNINSIYEEGYSKSVITLVTIYIKNRKHFKEVSRSHWHSFNVLEMIQLLYKYKNISQYKLHLYLLFDSQKENYDYISVYTYIV